MKTKSMIWLVVVMLLTFQLSSCSEHIDDEWHGNITPGCILLSNNQIISEKFFDTTKMNAVGVVIGTRQDTVWVVNTKELGRFSYLDTLSTVSDVSSNETLLCGLENTAAILKSGRKSPAVNVVMSYSSTITGWSLPSIGELKMLSANLETIRKSMQTIKGDVFSTSPYLSSTPDGSSSQTEELYAKCITLQSGYVSSILKTDAAQIRPVLRIKVR